jgi:hypothetical protein
MIMSLASITDLNELIIGQQLSEVVSSHNTNSLSGFTSVIESERCLSNDVDIITFCSMFYFDFIASC